MHNPTPELVDAVLSLFYKIAPFISFNELINALQFRDNLPYGYIISFDDGYRQNFKLLNVLDKYNCKAIFYVSTRMLDTNKDLWFTKANSRLQELKHELKNCNYNEFLFKIENLERLSSSFDTRKGLNSFELKEILKRGHNIGVHTENHPFLSMLTSTEICLEVLGSYKKIEKCVGTTNLFFDFAYPDGDYNLRVVSALKKIGVRSAVTIVHKDIDLNNDILRLPRYGAADNDYAGFTLFKQTKFYAWLKSTFA